MNLAYDIDGYELEVGDYVACGKKLYRISKISSRATKRGIIIGPGSMLELIHVKTTKIVKRSDHEVERLS